MNVFINRKRSVDASAAIVSVVLTAALGLAVIVFARWGPDWPAQEFRAWIAAHDGLSVWTNRWYGGTALPGYSVLYPPLAGVIGAGPTGLLSAVALVWAAMGLAPARPARAVLFGVGSALVTCELLLVGQVPYLFGAVFGVLAVRALLGARPWGVVAVFAALCSLASPLPGAFLILCAPALAVATSWRRAVPLLAAATGSVVSLVVGGADGPFPCQWQSLVSILGFCAVLALATLHLVRSGGPTRRVADSSAPDEGCQGDRALQVFALTYALAALVIFFVPNPIGGNIERLGKLIAVPMVCCFVSLDGRWRRLHAVAATVLALAWTQLPMTTVIGRGEPDPSQHGSYFAGLNRFLQTQRAADGRLEIPFTREHWETYWVAQHFPLARGWERQLDLGYNRTLYQQVLSPADYRRWLDTNAVALVALPTVPIGYGGRAEAALLQHPPGYLHVVWHDADWTVWRVHGAPHIVTGAAQLADLGSASMTLHFASAGTALVHVSSSRLWVVDAGAACIDAAPSRWLHVVAPRPGTVRLAARLNTQLVTGADGCPSG
jgi:hypothetical protein